MAIQTRGFWLEIAWSPGLLEKKKTLTKLSFNVYTDVDNRERARARDKKQTRRGLLEKQHENFISAVKFCEKTRNARGRQGEASKVKMGGNEKKKANRNTSDKIFGELIRHFFP